MSSIVIVIPKVSLVLFSRVCLSNSKIDISSSHFNGWSVRAASDGAQMEGLHDKQFLEKYKTLPLTVSINFLLAFETSIKTTETI